MIIVVMGVAGSGKTTLGRALAAALGWVFVEGDDYHPAANIAKMARGAPLDDADRAPWLQRLNRRLAALDASGADAVLACSALKARYRERLAAGLGDVRFVHLAGDAALVERRLRARVGHFMPADLLASQALALELPDDALPVPIELPTERQVHLVLQAIRRG
jgi:carbohydrate kinase (thermoresistant glucokinase family)